MVTRKVQGLSDPMQSLLGSQFAKTPHSPTLLPWLGAPKPSCSRLSRARIIFSWPLVPTEPQACPDVLQGS